MEIAARPRHITGALRFVAELEALAAECAATGAFGDELTARRRQREDRPQERATRERHMKAL